MKLTRKNIIIAIIWAATVIAPSSYFYYQYRHAQDLLSNPTQATKEEVSNLMNRIGQYVILPNETPSIATITDISKVAGQPFFAKAAVGDKVLIFTQARKAILYRPSTGKIIEFAPLGIGVG